MASGIKARELGVVRCKGMDLQSTAYSPLSSVSGNDVFYFWRPPLQGKSNSKR